MHRSSLSTGNHKSNNLPLQIRVHKPTNSNSNSITCINNDNKLIMVSPQLTAQTQSRNKLFDGISNHYDVNHNSQYQQQNLYQQIQKFNSNNNVENQSGNFERGSFGKYDLPRQKRDYDGATCHYQLDKYIENRPFNRRQKQPYNMQQNHIIYAQQNQKINIPLTQYLLLTSNKKQNNSSAKGKVNYIYQKLLEQCKKDKKQPNILTQATFKPKQLKKQLSKPHSSSCVQHQNSKKIQSPCFTHSKQSSYNFLKSLNRQSSQPKLKNNINKKLNFNMISQSPKVKTKYQRILSQHFHNTQPTSRKQQKLTAQQIRLSRICGKNSAVLNMKVKQRIIKQRAQSNKHFSISEKTNCIDNLYNSKKQNIKSNIYQSKKVQEMDRNKKLRQQIIKRIQGKTSQTTMQKHTQKHKQNKPVVQSQRWMQMDFHARQQRIISNRKQKQLIGKQQKMQKQIKPCTFKPQLNRSKSLKTAPNQKTGYLQQYYQRLNRKY